jgi:apoptosis-inducing factor 3
LLATGASPIRLDAPGFDRSNVFVLRTLGDARAIIAAASRARRVAIVGASFIGLEAAASLKARGLDVEIVAPERVPLERIMGEAIGRFVQKLHEAKGVKFHLERTAIRFDGARLWLSDGGGIDADMVILGVGVRPNTELARGADLAVENGVLVDEFLCTSDPRIFAAGDIANYPDALTGERVRVEHWVAAQRQGQTAALNMLGAREQFTAPPFFWSHHYEHSIRYVGHAKTWDRIEIEGAVERADFSARFIGDGRLLAAASLGRDRDNLQAEQILARPALAARTETLASVLQQ